MEPTIKKLIKDLYLLHRKNAILISYYLEKDFNIKVSKDKVYLVLKEFGLIQPNPKKTKPRKRVRMKESIVIACGM